MNAAAPLIIHVPQFQQANPDGVILISWESKTKYIHVPQFQQANPEGVIH